ncbi:MAG: aquaporin [Gemmatimonadaceae bacterium]
MRRALEAHWREYLLEAVLLGCFMLSASSFAVLLEHPASPVRQGIDSAVLRRVLMGCAMGLTAVTLIYSPWGRRSGAHINPATTLTFFRLGRVSPWDAAFYVSAQFVGAVAGMLIASRLLGLLLAAPTVNFVSTQPGMRGPAVAFAAELVISCVLASCVLRSNASPRLRPYTGLMAGALVATFITVEAPLSGMSMNPARSFGSAVVAAQWTAICVYFTAPPLGMQRAAQIHLRGRGRVRVCAKYRPHAPGEACHFCAWADRDDDATRPPPPVDAPPSALAAVGARRDVVAR